MSSGSSHRSAKAENSSRLRLARLEGERKKLSRRLDQVDEKIGRLKSKPKPLSKKELARILDELATIEGASPLPDDFSRADLYADHD